MELLSRFCINTVDVLLSLKVENFPLVIEIRNPMSGNSLLCKIKVETHKYLLFYSP